MRQRVYRRSRRKEKVETYDLREPDRKYWGKIRQPRRFSLLPGESIKEGVRRERVPNAPGIYIYFERDDLEHPLYIGKSGTIRADGSWKNQGISVRLTMKQEGIFRREFFLKLMANECPAGLTFIWFVTHDQNTKIIPGLAEMELLQAHYDLRGCLSRLNKCVRIASDSACALGFQRPTSVFRNARQNDRRTIREFSYQGELAPHCLDGLAQGREQEIAALFKPRDTVLGNPESLGDPDLCELAGMP